MSLWPFTHRDPEKTAVKRALDDAVEENQSATLDLCAALLTQLAGEDKNQEGRQQ